MTDRELLEMAAKAAGLKINYWERSVHPDPVVDEQNGEGFCFNWNPLESDGDALRLAVKLGIDLLFYPHTSLEVSAVPNDELSVDSTEPYGTDPHAATRRAIVRAAAEIGKEMK